MSAIAPHALPPLARVLVLASRRATADAVLRELDGAAAEVHTAEGVMHATDLVLDNAYDAVVLYADVDDVGVRRFARRLRRLRVCPTTFVLGSSEALLVDAPEHAVAVRLPLDGSRFRHELQRVLGAGERREYARTARPPYLALVGSSTPIEVLREQIRALARAARTSVLLVGERGVGKGDVARALHEATATDGAGVLRILSAADSSPRDLEHALSTLARGTNVGAGRTATLYLEDVEALPSESQSLLERTWRHVGDAWTARLVAGTGRRGLRDRLGGGGLFQLLAGFVLHVPPLRDRCGDIPELVRALLARRGSGNGAPRLEPGAEEILGRLAWPGNLDLLSAVVETALDIAGTSQIGEQEFEAAFEKVTGGGVSVELGEHRTEAPLGLGRQKTLRQIEYDAISAAFEQARGNVTLAAKNLGIPRSTLRDRLRRLGMR